MTTLKCDECGRLETTPLTPDQCLKPWPPACIGCATGVMRVTDDRPLRDPINETHHPKGDELSDRADPLGVDPWREDLQTGPDARDMAEFPVGDHGARRVLDPNEVDEPDTRMVDIIDNTAYINVLALMVLTEVEDTLKNRSLMTAPMAAMLRERGYDIVLVGYDEPLATGESSE